MAKIEDTLDEAPTSAASNGSYTTETGDSPTSFTTESTPSEAPKAPRAILNVPGAAVGRRKEAIARVRIIPGGDTFTVNGRQLRGVLPEQAAPAAHQRPVQGSRPARLVQRDRQDHGRRPLGPGWRTASRHRPLAERDRPREQPSGAQEGRLPHSGCPRHRAQEGRSQEGSQGVAVLQALIRSRTGVRRCHGCSVRTVFAEKRTLR